MIASEPSDPFDAADAFDTLAAVGAGLCGHCADDCFLPTSPPGGPPDPIIFEGSRAEVLMEARRIQTAYERHAFVSGSIWGRSVYEVWQAFERTAIVVAAAATGAAAAAVSGDARTAPVVAARPTDAAEGRGLPAGARFTVCVFLDHMTPAVGAPGWCADVRDSLLRGDPERLAELWRTLGRVAIAPNLDRRAARCASMACVNVVWVYGDRFGGRQPRDPNARPDHREFLRGPAHQLMGVR